MELYKKIRRDWGKSDAKRDAKKTIPANIERFDDIAYGEDTMQLLDVYRPKDKACEKLPVILNVHGGGWVYGSKEVYQYYCMELALQGVAVVNFSYRLAPENKYPAQLEDINSVASWICDNATSYGFDLENVFGIGDSAGANMLALYACFCTNSTYASKFDYRKPEDFGFNAVVLNCGIYDLEKFVVNGVVTEELSVYAMPNGGTIEDARLFTVANFLSKDFPPSYIMTCSHDFLREQAPLFVEKLSSFNLEYEYKLFEKKHVKLEHVFHLNSTDPIAMECNMDEVEFMKKHIRLRTTRNS